MSECNPTPRKPAERFEEASTDIFEALTRYNGNTTAMTMHAHVCQTPNCPAMNTLHRQGAAIMDQILGQIEKLRETATEIRDSRLMMVSEDRSSAAN